MPRNEERNDDDKIPVKAFKESQENLLRIHYFAFFQLQHRVQHSSSIFPATQFLTCSLES